MGHRGGSRQAANQVIPKHLHILGKGVTLRFRRERKLFRIVAVLHSEHSLHNSAMEGGDTIIKRYDLDCGRKGRDPNESPGLTDPIS
jgi:hypothetical protein